MKSPRNNRSRKHAFSLSRLFGFGNDRVRRDQRAYRKSVFGLGRAKLESLESRIVLTAATLSIFVDGDEVAIPADIGVDSFGDRVSQVITLDGDGTLDIDPIDDEPLEDVTLGDFFDTWRTNANEAVGGNNLNAIFNARQLLDNSADTSSTVQMFVNGQVNRDFEDYVIQEDDDIVLAYGDNPIVSFNTNFGPMLVELFEDEAPITVNNFLTYINDGDYENTIFHRAVQRGLRSDIDVIQGGGFLTTSPTFTSTDQITRTDTDPPIENEFGILNTRGTLSMAKSTDPDSATNQFFVNVEDNPGLDDPTNSGGFTVFAQVLGFDTVDEIVALPIEDVSGGDPTSALRELPLSADNTLAVIDEVVGLGEISGTKFNDANGNGIQDAGETPVPGATIFIDTNANGALETDEPSTFTDIDGRYLFQVEPGAYSIRTITTASFDATAPDGGSHATFVEIGREQSGLDFGQSPVDVDAIDDTATVINDGTSTPIGVLLNDSIPEGTTISAVTQGSEGGTVEINGGLVDYTPAADFEGEETFTYTIENSAGDTDTATVTVDVEPEPIGSVTGQIFLDRDEDGNQASDEVGVPGVEVRLSGTSDDGDEIELTTITDNDGSYTFDDVPDGTYTLTRTDSNAVEAVDSSDDGSANETTVVVSDREAATPDDTFSSSNLKAEFTSIIWFFASSDEPQEIFRDVMAIGEEAAGNDALADAIRGDEGTPDEPEDPDGGTDDPDDPGDEDPNFAAEDDEFTVAEDTTLAVSSTDGLLSNDTVSGDVTITVAEDVAIGDLVVSNDGSFTYTPEPNFNGSETFTYEVTSGSSSASATVVIEVTPVPDTPTAVDDTFELNEDQTLTRTAAGSVLANDLNPDEGELTASVVSDARGGQLTFNDDGSFVYVPDENFAGTDAFMYEIIDENGETDQAEVTLEVRPVNDAPIAEDASFSTTENETLAVDAVMGLLVGATDVEDDPLDALLTSQPNSGTVDVQRDGSFTYAPATDFVGTDTFEFVANDGSDDSEPATVSITVNAADEPSTVTFPTEFSDPDVPAIRNVGDTISFDVEVQDPDDDTSALTFLLDLEDSNIDATASQPTIDSSTGAFEWTPSETGSFEIRVIVINADGEANVETLAIDIV